MKKFKYLLIALFFVITIIGSADVQGAQDVLFQLSLLNALDKGVVEGEMTIKDLKQHGDFGIGTFNAIDGELIGVDGNFYRMDVDGAAQPAAHEKYLLCNQNKGELQIY